MDLSAFARKLRGSRDWTDIEARLRSLAATSPSSVVELAAALDAELADRGPDLTVWSVRDRLLTLLAGVPGGDASVAAVRLAGMPVRGAGPAGAEAGPDDLAELGRRLAASEVAGTRPAADLIALLGADERLRDDPELGLLLTHELVIRGEPVGEVAGPFVAWAVRCEHPLAALPAERDELEAELVAWLPRHPGSQRTDVPWPVVPHRAAVPLVDLMAGVARRIGPGPSSAGAAFADWVQRSNGSVDVAVFAPGVGYDRAAGKPPALRADRPARPLSPEMVCVRLLAAANGGGAYSRGLGGAFARLAMWESLAGLVGLEWPGTVQDVAAAARSARWIALEVSDHWFYDLAWDEWLVAETAERVTVLAATDTD